MNLKKVLFLLAVIVLVFAPVTNSHAQLRKTAHTEKVKSFTNGSVILCKTTTPDSATVYAVTLSNNSRLHENIVLFLGDKEDMMKNLHDFSDALKEGKKGDSFDFTEMGIEYNLSYHKVLGQRCFKVWKPYSTSSDYGLFFKITIDDIIEYMEKKSE